MKLYIQVIRLTKQKSLFFLIKFLQGLQIPNKIFNYRKHLLYIARKIDLMFEKKGNFKAEYNVIIQRPEKFTIQIMQIISFQLIQLIFFFLIYHLFFFPLSMIKFTLGHPLVFMFYLAFGNYWFEKVIILEG